MSKELVFMLAQPDDLMFVWQIEVQINNFRKYGLSSKLNYLMFLPQDRRVKGWNPQARELAIRYPEVNFFWYEDDEDILHKFVMPYQYIPLLRPFVLAKHFKQYPELKDKAIFYLDTDVVFTKYLDFIDKYKDDDICYLSDTRSYIAASYWDSKDKDVLPEKQEEYKTVDVLNQVSGYLGIDRATCVANEAGSGGAQYLLKNIDYLFWLECFKGMLEIRAALSYHVPGSINQRFFESENKGFQSWCADMWSVLWNLWRRGQKTECPPEMNFAWATDKIDKWKEVYLYHDAGSSPEPMIVDGVPHFLFHKRGRKMEYANNRTTPFDDNQHLLVSPDYCSSLYCKEIEDTKKNREFSVTLN